ncbi:MAG: hypothetical protein QM723_20035 [Myxococcaceae bacterium]
MTKLGAVLAVLLTTSAFAANVDVRQRDLQGRINQGVRDGSLNRREAVRLESREKAIKREIARDRIENGGRLTVGEKVRIEKQENRLSGSVYRERHDLR